MLGEGTGLCALVHKSCPVSFFIWLFIHSTLNLSITDRGGGEKDLKLRNTKYKKVSS